MDISKQYTDLAILSEIGERVGRCRLDRNLTQAKLAEAAGVSKRTIERMEKGESIQMTGFLQILRVLDLLGNLDSLVPKAVDEGPRKRASSTRRRKPGNEVWH
jgi:transcriptional regulator with XRE-family HTH domain